MKLLACIPPALLILTVLVMFNSSFYGSKTEVGVLHLNKFKPDSVKYFCETELFNGSYTLPDLVFFKIEIIKIEVKENTTEEELSALLRKEAFKIVAHTVFDVKVALESSIRGSALPGIIAAMSNDLKSSEVAYTTSGITG